MDKEVFPWEEEFSNEISLQEETKQEIILSSFLTSQITSLKAIRVEFTVIRFIRNVIKIYCS